MSLTNPVATLGFDIPDNTETLQNNRWEMVVFARDVLNSYKRGEPQNIPFSSANPPIGERSHYFQRMESIESGSIPFVSSNLWDNDGFFKNVPSGFVSGHNTIMPKLIVPTDKLVNNGIDVLSGDKHFIATYESSEQKLFNWQVFSINGTSQNQITDSDELKKYIGRSGASPFHVSFKWKRESDSDDTGLLKLPALGDSAPVNVGLWKPKELVLGGAFSIILGVIPSVLAEENPENIGSIKWEVKLSFGEVVMSLCDGGTLLVSINGNQTKVQLTEAAASEGVPQLLNMEGTKRYQITVYPVWNGLVVSSGIQDSENVKESASVYCPKSSGKNPFDSDYMAKFDPINPAPMEFEYAGHSDVVVDMGDTLNVYVNNCRLDLAYVPCFFAKEMILDCIFVGPKDNDSSSGYSYSQKIFPIWTKGGNSDAVLKINGSTDPANWKAEPLPSDLGGPLDFSDSEGVSEYRHIRFSLCMGDDSNLVYSRYSPEIIGFAVQHICDESSLKNPNSVSGDAFNVSWNSSSGNGDPTYTGSWQDYIQNISVSNSLDGSNATITIDKYGCAGWDAKVVQKIGAITIDISGGPFSSHGGRLFSGIAYGVGDTNNESSNTWTIQCSGLEKRCLK